MALNLAHGQRMAHGPPRAGALYWRMALYRRGAKMLDGGTGEVECRWPEKAVKSWSMAATYVRDKSLLNKKLEVMIEGNPKEVVTVQVLDVCADSDCDGCCPKATGERKWKLIDLEKWAASELLGFSTSSPNFDVNQLDYPVSVGKRPGAQEKSVMPLCYKVVKRIRSKRPRPISGGAE
eukprot:gene26083-11789_t